jgi:hypothetical protein
MQGPTSWIEVPAVGPLRTVERTALRARPGAGRPGGGVPTGRWGAGSVGRGPKSACADLDGRSGPGLWPSPQRSVERVCPAVPRRVGEKALCSGPFRADAESSQPPSRSEQPSPDANSPVDCSPPGEGPGHWPGAACKASVPSPQARAATAKPRRDTALGPRTNAAREATVRNGPPAAFHRAALRFYRHRHRLAYDCAAARTARSS